MSIDKTYAEQIATVLDLFTNETKIPCIMGLQIYDKPKDEEGETRYPYIGYTILSQALVSNLISEEGLERDVFQEWHEQWQLTISFVAVGNNYYNTIETARLLYSWLKNAGRNKMSDRNIAYVSATQVTSRDFLLVNDYERRQGFDCVLRFDRFTTATVERILEVKIKDNL